MSDCLILGYYDPPFAGQVDLIRSMGEETGAFRDLNLAFVELEGSAYRSMDLLNLFRSQQDGLEHRFLHNMDFLWPTITYLASYLDRRGLTFDYVNLPHLEEEKLRQKLTAGDPRTVAITTTLYVSPHPIIDLIARIRRYNDQTQIVVGGPFISNQARSLDETEFLKLLHYLDADFYVVNQEGEAALAALLETLRTGGDPASIPNLAYRSAHGFALTSSAPESNGLEENPVDYSLFPRSDIGEFVSLRTAKSCPFACSFCGFPQRAGKYRYLDVEHVERELDALRELGSVTTLTFLDDTFNVPKKRFKALLEMMIANGYDFKWNSFYRCDHGDDEIIDLMARAGCEGVFLGVEAGSDEMLKRMNKSASRADYLHSIPALQDAGISTHANLIIGFPGETLETYEASVSLIEQARPDFYRAQLWYCDPVTPIWNRRHEFGVEGSAFNWSHDTMDHRTASDLVERMFVEIEGSEWLPQHGFEQWSTFYLQRKGMALDEIKRFVAAFNALVATQLEAPGRTPTELIEELIASSLVETPLLGSAATREEQPARSADAEEAFNF